MLNLLIREDRHWLRKEYLLRFSLVIMFFIIGTLLILGVVISSFYIQLRVDESIAKNELETIINSSDNKNINELVDLDKQLDNKFKEIEILHFNQGDTLKEVVLNNREGISVSLITNTFSSDENKFYASVEIRGIAEDRFNLVEYQTSLESSDLFEEVKIPFSSFAQNSEIPFSVNIKTVELNEYFKDEK